MAPESHDFQYWREAAARDFAQTLIIIDDEASQRTEISEAPVVGTLKRPGRSTAQSATTIENHSGSVPGIASSHALDAKALIDQAMDLGLICSVLRPKERENFVSRVVRAAEAADIVCLDWEIYNDGGKAATNIIKEIVKKDAARNGRLRLIAIYTGDTTNIDILDRVFNAIPQLLRRKHNLKRESLQIVGTEGLRIVCLFKTHGVQLAAPGNANQVSEIDLPRRLQHEFASLSGGLLSSLALGTIASIRNSTHHVLSKFMGRMDGPYFHHRSCIQVPEDAEEYAVEVVLSELKSVVDKLDVAKRYAGDGAIAARIREISGNTDALTLSYMDKCTEKKYQLPLDVVTRIVQNGLASLPNDEKGANPPKTTVFENSMSSLFSSDHASSYNEMLEFSALTGIRAHPGSYLYKSGKKCPKLGLGSIIRSRNGGHLLCLQASCDSVRIKESKAFLFVPLEKTSKKPEHTVPIVDGRNVKGYVGLATSDESYTVVKSIEFSASDGTGTVSALMRPTGLFFQDKEGKKYRWIADLKRRRALRTVQRLGQQMGRLGFDEFEPFRIRESMR